MALGADIMEAVLRAITCVKHRAQVSIWEHAQPSRDFLGLHCANLSEEARVALAVQITLANQGASSNRASWSISVGGSHRTSVHGSGVDAALRARMTLCRLDDLLRACNERIAVSRATIESSRTTLGRVHRGHRGVVLPRGYGNLGARDARACDQSATSSEPRRASGP